MDCHAQSTNVLWQNANHDRQMHYDNTITADENVIQKVKKNITNKEGHSRRETQVTLLSFVFQTPTIKCFNHLLWFQQQFLRNENSQKFTRDHHIMEISKKRYVLLPPFRLLRREFVGHMKEG